MDTHATFAPAGGIQELSFDEIDQVDGAGLGNFFKKLFNFISRITPGVKISIFGIVISDGIPNHLQGSSSENSNSGNFSGGRFYSEDNISEV
jgi:hypothetical protein